MTRFIHLTDLHLSHDPSGDPDLHSDTAAALQTVIDTINAMEPAPDFVVLSGDLANHGDPESYELLRQMLDKLTVPAIPALGNHDDRAAYRGVFGGADAPEAPLFHHAAHGGVHVITLDSSQPGKVAGDIEPAQFTALRAALEAHPELPKLLICHHPPHPGRDDTLSWESLNEADTAELAEILDGHRIVAMLSGHVHLNRLLDWQGIPVVITTGLHMTVDILERRDLVIQEGTSFAICRYETGGIEVTYVPLTPATRELHRIDAEVLRSFG